jgi:hypothetical protein
MHGIRVNNNVKAVNIVTGTGTGTGTNTTTYMIRKSVLQRYTLRK